MILVKFKGGLGNQMLEYATYMAIKTRNPNRRVKADVTYFNIIDVHNGLELEEVFPIKLDVFLGSRSRSLLAKYWFGILEKALLLMFKSGLLPYGKYIKDTNSFNSEVLNLKPKLIYFIDGYWGNERYFTEIKDIIKEHFVFDRPLSYINENIKSEILSSNSVSLHIRRGDFLTSPGGFFNLSGTSYYPDALTYLQEVHGSCKFFIFSDDSDWCKENLDWLSSIEHFFVTGNTGPESYVDMQLMSLCKHNIIANSTFSWWGAWLNNNHGKDVIAPKQLFNDEEKNANIIREFYPNEWILI